MASWIEKALQMLRTEWRELRINSTLCFEVEQQETVANFLIENDTTVCTVHYVGAFDERLSSRLLETLTPAQRVVGNSRTLTEKSISFGPNLLYRPCPRGMHERFQTCRPSLGPSLGPSLK